MERDASESVGRSVGRSVDLKLGSCSYIPRPCVRVLSSIHVQLIPRPSSNSKQNHTNPDQTTLNSHSPDTDIAFVPEARSPIQYSSQTQAAASAHRSSITA